MKVILLDNAVEGMSVAKSIYGPNGEILLAKGVQLTPRYIQRLKDLGIPALYITDEALGEFEINDLVNEKTRIEANQIIQKAMGCLRVSSKVNLEQVNDIINNILDELLSNKNLLVTLIEIRAMNDHTFSHSVNVAILSILTGISRGYEHDALKKLALGALFHDLGKTLLPENLLNKAEPLTPEEQDLMNNHVQVGFDILRKIPDFNLLAAHIALQHHEKFDGTGFPRGLKGEEISEFARIVTVADLYDRMTANRGGYSRCQPFQAVELLVANSGIFFDPAIVQAFIKSIAIFPIGTQVVLNTGEEGVIIEANKEYPTRPKVRALVSSEGQKINPPYDIDLVDNPNCCVVRIVEEG